MLQRGLRLFLASWRHGLRRRRAWTVAAIGLIAVIEVFGRLTHHDVADLGWMASVLLFLVFVSVAHRQDRIPWYALLLRSIAWVGATVQRSLGELGVDFRGTPPYPLGLPPILSRGLPALLLLLASLAAFGVDVAGGLRWLGVHSSFSLYLLVLGALWWLHGIVLLAVGYVTLGLVREFARSGGSGPDGRPPRWRGLAGQTLLCAVVVCVVVAPPVWALAVLAACPFVHAIGALWPGRPTLALLWIPRGGRTPQSAPWELLFVLQHGFVLLLALAVVATTRGVDVWLPTHDASPMPVSRLLGGVTAWVSAGGAVALTAYALHVVHLSRRRNTATDIPVSLCLAAGASTDDVATVRRAVPSSAVIVRAAGRAPRRGDVVAHLVDAADPFTPRVEIGRDELASPATVERLRRRSAVVQRRLLLRTLERVLKHARGVAFKRGTGFLIAPHVWFISGLLRDEEEEDTPKGDPDRGTLDGRIGPRWDRLLPRATRHHAHDVFHALDVDVLYVEDGVPWRRLRLVLKRMFELYDRHNGDCRAEDPRFSGIPGVLVVVDEIAPDDPLRVPGYPEPKYNTLGRARVLHVFRDRGGEEDKVREDAPADLVPLLV